MSFSTTERAIGLDGICFCGHPVAGGNASLSGVPQAWCALEWAWCLRRSWPCRRPTRGGSGALVPVSIREVRVATDMRPQKGKRPNGER